MLTVNSEELGSNEKWTKKLRIRWRTDTAGFIHLYCIWPWDTLIPDPLRHTNPWSLEPILRTWLWLHLHLVTFNWIDIILCIFRFRTGLAINAFVSRRTSVRVRKRQPFTRQSSLGRRRWPACRMQDQLEGQPSLRRCPSWNQPTASVWVETARSLGVSMITQFFFYCYTWVIYFGF